MNTLAPATSKPEGPDPTDLMSYLQKAYAQMEKTPHLPVSSEGTLLRLPVVEAVFIKAPSEWPWEKQLTANVVERSLLAKPELRHLSVLPYGCMWYKMGWRTVSMPSPAPGAQ
ncbi:hypothetical protein LUCX_134 [Xanthomonas phage vB_XciM_LucasX]|nr:hypothetical protein LUCX_134 [Xanthomonas phage vB_XciM_LucasX]